MKTYLSAASLLTALALSITTATTPAQAADPFSGTWKIREAETLDHKPYTGTVRIGSIGAVYELRWNTSAGSYAGLGLADGDKLCTGWGGKTFGVVLYAINGDGSLDGRWTIPGANEAEGTERAVGGEPGQVEGTYTIKGTNPGGKGGYEGKLNIRKTGDTFQLKWTIPGSPPYAGVGLRVGNSLHVGWGGGREPFGVVSYSFDGDGAAGIWSVGGASRSAKENLVKD